MYLSKEYLSGEFSFCEHLKYIYSQEIQRGNKILYISLMNGPKHFNAVFMEKPLHDYECCDNEVESGVNTDPHYPSEKYYKCEQCRWIISGPAKLNQQPGYCLSAKKIVAPEEMNLPDPYIDEKGNEIRPSIYFLNVINPKVIATESSIHFEAGFEDYIYAPSWQIIPTLKL